MPNPICPSPATLKVKCVNTNEGANGLTITELAQQLAPVFGLSNLTLIVDRKTVGIDGGTFTQGGWETRELNTISFGAQNIIGVSGNRVQLFESPYLFFGWAPARQVEEHQTRVVDVQNSLVVGFGQTQSARNTDSDISTSIYAGFVAASSPPPILEVQHQCSQTKLNDGFGSAGFGAQGETYASIILAKLDGPEG